MNEDQMIEAAAMLIDEDAAKSILPRIKVGANVLSISFGIYYCDVFLPVLLQLKEGNVSGN